MSIQIEWVKGLSLRIEAFVLSLTTRVFKKYYILSFQFSHSMSVWKCYILPISLFSILYNIPKFLELRVTWLTDLGVTVVYSSVNIWDVNVTDVCQPGPCPHNGSLCADNVSLSPALMVNMSEPETGSPELLSIEATELRLNPDYVKFYLIYFNFFISSLIPFILLIIMNFFIYRTVG